jgi:hypothetical protein
MQQIEPPKIALIYRNSSQNFIHEIHLPQAARRDDDRRPVRRDLLQPFGYFEKVDPMQLLNLLDMLKGRDQWRPQRALL